MKRLLYFCVVSLFLITSCEQAGVIVDDSTILTEKYAGDVLRESEEIGVLLKSLNQNDAEALSLVLTEDFGGAMVLQENNNALAEEILSKFSQLEQDRPSTTRLPEDVEALLNKIGAANSYASLATSESQAITTAKLGIEEVSGKKLNLLDDYRLNGYLQELVCFSFTSLNENGALPSKEEYYVFFVDNAIGFLLPPDFEQIYSNIGGIKSFSEDVANGGTSVGDTNFKSHLEEVCNKLLEHLN